jgi:hypothetical protein
MMRTNACQYGGDLAPEIVRVALDADDDIVVRLLRLGWRERVMGAWLSVTRDSEKVTSEVLRQLEGSHGSLDAPPLAAAAVTLVGPAAMASLAIYHQADVAEQWGAADIIQEAAQFLQERFGAANPLPRPVGGFHPTFDTLLAVADAIRGAH